MISMPSRNSMRVEPLPMFRFPYHRVSTEYAEASYSGQLGGGAIRALPPTDPAARTFNLFFETMREHTNPDGSPDVDTDPELNLSRLVWWYHNFKQARVFGYQHPAWGVVAVRFMEPVTVPMMKRGGHGWTEGFSVRLIEQPRGFELLQNRATVRSYGADDFQFPHHTAEVATLPLSNVVGLGGGYVYAVGPNTREQRIFRLKFQAMRYLLNAGGFCDTTTWPEINAGKLEDFYNQMRMNRVFNYLHPHYGKVPVRFYRPLVLPEGLQNGNGFLPGFDVQLIEDL